MQYYQQHKLQREQNDIKYDIILVTYKDTLICKRYEIKVLYKHIIIYHRIIVRF